MIKPGDYLYSLVDFNEVCEIKSQAMNDQAQLLTAGVCDEILQGWTPSMYPRTIEGTQSYLNALTSNICGAKHEKIDNGITVHNCKIRECNVSCLHGVELTRHPDGHIQFGTDMWSTRVFAVAYVLHKLGYPVPLLIDNFLELQKEMRKYDKWDMNGFFDDKIHEASNPATEAFQKRISEEFMKKYINPIKAQFNIFWEKEVDNKA